MTIECNFCNQPLWCIYHAGDWICKACFLENESGGTIEEWDEINDQARKRREEKRRMQADEDYQESSPYPSSSGSGLGSGSSPRGPKPKLCKYGCETMLVWDDRISDDSKNKFKEVESGERHTLTRCQLYKNNNKTRGR